jgi:UDP-N-acetylmuramoylalanine--D-glutamate ligase
VKVLIGGYGRAGRGAATLCRTLGFETVIYQNPPLGESDIQDIPDLNFIDTVNEESTDGVELVVVSPGIAPSHPIFSLGIEVVSELSFARRYVKGPLVAVTGTNGKTTVSTLIHQMLERSDIRSGLFGNIGDPLSNAYGRQFEAYVVEASSFQLAYSDQLDASGAAILNFAPDHLDWHGTVDSYLDAKVKVASFVIEGGQTFISRDFPMVQERLDAYGFLYKLLPNGSYYFDESRLVLADSIEIDLSSVVRRFHHDLTNFIFAAALAKILGAKDDAIREVVTNFSGLAHRLEYVGDVMDIAIYDDSKATTPDATVNDLENFSNVVAIMGGRNKGIDLSPLRVLSDRLIGVVAIGESAQEIADVFSTTSVPVAIETNMDSAVERAFSMATSGSTIVLSPAVTSWDMYSSYVERGKDFKRAVASLARSKGEGHVRFS